MPVKVWDLPIRLFHWLLVALFALSWWSAENHRLDLHLLSGLTMLGLLVFRVLWGVIGSSTARFAGFVRAPGAVLAYVRGPSQPAKPGHNPLGGYSVIALLGLLALQVGTGLFATDTDGLEYGPLNFLVSYDVGDAITEVHEVAFNLLLALVGIHLLAILFYRVVRRRNLILPMVTGRDAELDPATPAMVPAGVLRFVVAAVVAAALAWWTSKGFGL